MAKANRVIQKPSPPSVKYIAIIDPDTGVISGYASSNNIVIGDVESGRNWKDITHLPGAKQLGGKLSRKLVHNGIIKNKPRIRIKVNKSEVNLNEEADITIEVIDGDPALVPTDILLKVGGRRHTLKRDEKLKVKGSKEKDIAISVIDPRVFVEESDKATLRIGKRHPSPPHDNDDGVVIVKGKKNG